MKACLPLIFLLPLSLFSQNEASVWVLKRNFNIRFTQAGPITETTGPFDSNDHSNYASIADKGGTLLLYTNGETVWNGNGQVMKNGTGIVGTGPPFYSIIVPKPGSDSLYYIFTVAYIDVHTNLTSNDAVFYTEVDVSADGGRGEVQKTVTLYEGLHGSITISGNCMGDKYWLVGETDTNVTEGTDKILTFWIDKNGVTGVTTSTPLYIGNSGRYQFTSRGDKLYFVHDGTPTLADFNATSGLVSNPYYMPGTYCCPSAEFSPSGRFVYMAQINGALTQFDVATHKLDTLAVGSFGGPRLAPDNKIYVPLLNQPMLAVIENPEGPGNAAGYNPNGISLPFVAPDLLPIFPTNFLYLRPRIRGSKSVCPGVQQVDYRSDFPGGFSYAWTVAGGTLVSGQGTDSVKVNWRPSNFSSGLELIEKDELGCSDTVNLKVKVEMELETEAPVDFDSLCVNLAASRTYAITNTNGSVYTWGISGGIINAGQGTSNVSVTWQPSPTHTLWVHEQSVTNDTVCFGVSDTLRVGVFKGLPTLTIDFLTVDMKNDSIIGMLLSSGHLERIKNIRIKRKAEGETFWQPLRIDVPPLQQYYVTDSDVLPDAVVYQYQLTSTDQCKESIQSRINNSIRLSVEGNEEQKQVKLQWNPYDGWPDGVLRYEIWRKVDKEPNFSLLDTVDGNSTSNVSFSADAGFKQTFRVRAINHNGIYSSWSGKADIEFQHKIFIPNIITPNGDGKNETFEIKELQLYPENELIMVNRYGNEVYHKRNYQGGWSGEELSSGVYYYQLTLYETMESYKGWLQILK